MNSFFYFDAVKDDPIFYHIITDLSKQKLIDFLKKKANDFCENNNIDSNDFLNGEYDSNYIVRIKISDKTYRFSLFSLLTDDIKKRLFKKNIFPETLILNIEDII